MTIDIDGKQYEIDGYNSEYRGYIDNDMFNGLFIDLGENYMFMSERINDNNKLIGALLVAEQIEVVISDHFDITKTPDMWIASSLARIVVRSFEDIAREAV